LKHGPSKNVASKLARLNVIGHDLPSLEQFSQNFAVADVHVLRLDAAILDEHAAVHTARNEQTVRHKRVSGETPPIPNVNGTDMAIAIKLIP